MERKILFLLKYLSLWLSIYNKMLPNVRNETSGMAVRYVTPAPTRYLRYVTPVSYEIFKIRYTSSYEIFKIRYTSSYEIIFKIRLVFIVKVGYHSLLQFLL